MTAWRFPANFTAKAQRTHRKIDKPPWQNEGHKDKAGPKSSRPLNRFSTLPGGTAERILTLLYHENLHLQLVAWASLRFFSGQACP
jgi:hypothetical protein